MLLTPSYGIKNMLETLMVDHLHNYALLERSGFAQEPKIWWKLIKNWFFWEEKLFMAKAHFAKWCPILLVGRPKHFARDIGLDVIYLDAFRGAQKGWIWLYTSKNHFLGVQISYGYHTIRNLLNSTCDYGGNSGIWLTWKKNPLKRLLGQLSIPNSELKWNKK